MGGIGGDEVLMFHIVDDRPELLNVLEEMVEIAGFSSKRFNSAEAYLEYFDSESFEAPIAILSDYEMGGLTGLELIERVRERIPLQKAVIISGAPSDELGQTAQSLLCHLLAKPFHVDELINLLEQLSLCNHECLKGANVEHHRCTYGINQICPFHAD